MSNFPRYDTKLFSEIWSSATAFKTDYAALPTGLKVMTESEQDTIYYLLVSRFKNSPIANFDEEQWKSKVFTTIYQYGPSWAKRIDIQTKLRNISDADLLKGSEAIYNHAYNPEQEPSTDARDALTYINEQNATLYNKSKMDAYAQIWDLIATDVTSEFLNRFTKLFKQVVKPERTWIYINEED